MLINNDIKNKACRRGLLIMILKIINYYRCLLIIISKIMITINGY